MTVLALSTILVAGLYTVKKNTAAQVTTEIQPLKRWGSSVKKGNKGRKEKGRKENIEAAEKAVDQMEKIRVKNL